ncbi:RecQ family zinc-binding domain-containing protein [uncultured Thiodictyon sp.]|uniref:RecQ family zinc-binding domain-containing protein n=1 Tax=uncultured Thiodictyon sp. TaxID=1846217 RepID=UPI0025F796E2|nr:RecQ family zinc-binding domain-containing protein [uncultured Thiodictyon sp.]
MLCDFSHQARFIQDSYPGVEADCKTTYGVYNWLKEGRPLASQDGFTPPRCSGDDVKDTPDIDSKQTVYQLALYRLQQLGIVRDYTIQYFGRKDKWRFEVEFNTHWSPQSLLDHVMRFLERSRRPDSDDVAEPMQVLTALAAQCGSPPWAAEHCRTEEALLKKAIGTLLRRVYARVRTMRLQMLRNELDYVRAAEGTCRRVTLLNLFNDKLVAPDYRCEFCDICVPDLNFDQAQATDAVGNVDLEELLLRLNDLLATAKPEPARLHDFIRQVEDRGVLLGTLARATRHLEGDPASLSALYLAGALSWRIPARQNQALGYFRAGFQQGHQQGVTQDILLGLFYRTGAEIDPEEAVRWLNGIGSRLAPNDFLTWVQSQELLLGCDSAAYRVLSAIAKVRALGCLKGPLRELNALAISLSNKRSKRPRRMLSLKKRLDQ